MATTGKRGNHWGGEREPSLHCCRIVEEFQNLSQREYFFLPPSATGCLFTSLSLEDVKQEQMQISSLRRLIARIQLCCVHLWRLSVHVQTSGGFGLDQAGSTWTFSFSCFFVRSSGLLICCQRKFPPLCVDMFSIPVDVVNLGSI